MQAGGTNLRGPTRRKVVVLQVVLALLLALSPLLGSAQIRPATAVGSSETGLVHAMPCHTQAPEAVQNDSPGGCPHCDGDSPASACQCSGHIAPLGLLLQARPPGRVPAGRTPSLGMPSDDLPTSPTGRLFRPPI